MLKIQAFIFTIFCISFLATGQNLKPTEVMRLLPNKIKGYSPADDFKSKELKMGTISYTLYEKKFSHNNKAINILLFDYSKANVMYDQALKLWNQIKVVESDSIVMRSVVMDGGKGWESYQRSTGKSQISLGIGERFFLNMSGENIELAELKSVLNEIQLSRLIESKPQSGL